ncbi:Haloacid dehalogenase domain protein hydrolase [Desulfarculus baarsii DSM 2075]|uniref:Haloacid dehalogenase domain protein hydrolase n=1 Tax=Desulfarculus baarsii (strain ATCC 33931 / DSM 2075 / LMG 7858 / VKM B-1802 / 2st14) TaxID=644282 RepID=E1QHE9_DESB2|nr:HAD hydrolase-like protein [Desulfarculus baarsii]ADK84992.1 Haloacid dehalogenase domain protein hydrolase [Desulfarculus baarsii DSM 2075]
MHLVMFDIDGTLVQSTGFDSDCFQSSVRDVLGTHIDPNWGRYTHVTDDGVLGQILDEHNVREGRERIFGSVKELFIQRIANHIAEHGVRPVPGAREFLAALAARDDVRLALATGGWLQTAELKLRAAAIDYAEIPIATSDDHYSRVKIMETAALRGGCGQCVSKTYFGDADWDMKASAKLGYNFVLVGNGFAYGQSIADYTDIGGILALIGLR